MAHIEALKHDLNAAWERERQLKERVAELEHRLESRTALKVGFADKQGKLTEAGWAHFRKQTEGTGLMLLSEDEAAEVTRVRKAAEAEDPSEWNVIRNEARLAALRESGGEEERCNVGFSGFANCVLPKGHAGRHAHATFSAPPPKDTR
jgi:hypothetical protein